CDRHQRIEYPGADQSFIDEVLDLSIRLQLRPTVMTGYRREPYVGTNADLGLRVTLDHKISGRDRDFDLRAEAENRFIIRHDLQVQRISKYCQSIEAHGLAPRSLFHAPEEDHVSPATLFN